MTLAARFEEWAQQHRQEGLEKGLEKGIAKGEARLLQRLLVARFGPLSQQTLSALEAANTLQLEAWTDRILNTRTLAEVFEAPAAS